MLSVTALALLLQCQRAPVWSALPGHYTEINNEEISLRSDPSDENEQLARRAPLEFLRRCRQRCGATVKDYRCRFVKQERIDGVMSADQQIDVAYRDEPFSVRMNWVENPGRAQEVSYVEDRWGENGQQLARIKLTGLLGVLAPAGVKRDIHSAEVAAASRKTIDQFGFRNTLDMIIEFCELAQNQPGYDLKYLGIAARNGREAYVLQRRLPFTVEDAPYPDRLLLIFIDRDLLLPVGCYAFADDAGRELLGKYVSKDVHLNVGLTDKDF